jgi:eukaryotic-like serine/threonine-protein kinase
MTDDTSHPFDAFISAFWKDVDAGAVRPLAEYLARFPGADDSIAREYLAIRDGAPKSGRESHDTRIGKLDQGSVAGDHAERIGPYRIVREIGRGGQGAVYLAQDTRVGRAVALKVLTGRALTSSVALERFRREATVASKLDHPGICPIFDVGLEGATPYLAMKLVPGESLASKISTARDRAEGDSAGSVSHIELPTTNEDAPPTQPNSHPNAQPPKTTAEIHRILKLIEDAARALHAAHEAGVVHRDVKPGNIMVTPDGSAMVLDFGLAEDSSSELPSLTLAGDLMGTPAYMSPEQIAAQRIRLDRRTDVYSLGVTLYECLTLRRPFDAPTREGLYQAILSKEAVNLRKLNPAIPNDLSVVVATAIERDRDRRYATALDFAEDLRRARHFEPILARPTPPLVRAAKWARRHPMLSAFGATVCGALALISWLAIDVAQKNDALSAQTRRAEMGELAANASLNRIERESYFANVTMAQANLDMRRFDRARERLSACPENLRGWEWRWLDSQCDSSIVAFKGHTAEVHDAAFSPDGARIVTASLDHSARIWDAPSGALIAELKCHTSSVRTVAFSPDGTRIVTASDDFTARIWDADSGTSIVELKGHTASVLDAAFSPNGARIVTASGDQTARIWDAKSGEMIAELKGHMSSVWTAAFSPDGARIVTASYDHTARIWDAASGVLIAKLKGHKGEVFTAAFSPDGARIVTASDDNTARIWDAATGTSIAELKGHTFSLLTAAFSPDGARIVTASGDNTARIWDAASGASTAELKGHSDWVQIAAFSPDGARIVTASRDQTARIWDAVSGASITEFRGNTGWVWTAAFSPYGAHILSASFDNTARIWDAASGASTAVLKGHSDLVQFAAFSPDGAHIVTAYYDRKVRIWDTVSGGAIAELLGHSGPVRTAAFSPDGARIVTASHDNTARIWDTASGASIAVLKGHSNCVTTAAFSPDGARILTASDDGTARTWDAASGEQITELCGHLLTSEHSGGLRQGFFGAFSPDGARVVTASNVDKPRIWDAVSGRSIAELRGHSGSVITATFSPDGDRIVTASSDNTAIIWDAASGASIATLRGHTETVSTAAFSPDGARIVTASDDHTARIWDAASGKFVAELMGHTETLISATFSPDGTRILTASDDNTARLWDAASGASTAVLKGHMSSVWTAVFCPDGARILTASGDQTARIWDSVTYRERFPAIERYRKARARVEPIVQKRIEDGTTIEQIRREAASNKSITSDERTAILVVTQAILDESK